MAFGVIPRRQFLRHILSSASKGVRAVTIRHPKCSARAREFSTISFDINDLRIAADQPSSYSESAYKSSVGSTADAIENETMEYVTSKLRSHQSRKPRQPHHKTVQAQHEIQHWIATNPMIAPYKAEEKLSQLWTEQVELLQTEEHPTILVTTGTVNLVLEAWAHSNSGIKGAERAERLLHWMEGLAASKTGLEPAIDDEFVGGAPYPVPDYRSYALTIEAWSLAAEYESSRASTKNDWAMKIGFECARKCEDMLMHMQKMHELRLDSQDGAGEDIQPDTNAFHHVLNAWSSIRNTKATAIRATRILDLMQELHHYQSMCSDTWQGVGVSKVQPNLVTYKTLLKAWANTDTAEGADQAELILRHLLSNSKAGNVGVEIHPDEECFHLVMKAHADSIRKRRKGSNENAADRARKVVALLDWMELLASRRAYKIKPIRETYRIAIRAWAWSRDANAPKEAEGVLCRMISASQLDRVEDAVDIILRENAPSRKSKKGKICEYPDTRDFNTVINCAAFARGIGDSTLEMDDDELVVQYQSERKEVFSIAESVFDALLKSEQAHPDCDTFLGMMRACQSLLPDNEERDARVIELFRLAYKTPLSEQSPSHKPLTTYSEKMKAPKGGGCVDANVLQQLRLALPSTEEYISVREEWEEFRRKNNRE